VEQKILIFWIIVYAFVWLLRRNPENIVSQAAFAWIGPRPKAGESWARFQLRWASYSFGWLCQFSLLFSALFALAAYAPPVSEHTWFRVLSFALILGLGVALLAMLGFLFKACKARWLGPNPSFSEPESSKNAA